MRKWMVAAAMSLAWLGVAAQVVPVQHKSPTEGVITHEFVDEGAMMSDLLQMLADNMAYAKSIWQDCKEPNSRGETCGFFRANSAGASNEDGVRTNADFSMLCAFIYKYGKGKATLPQGMTWEEVRDMAVKSLVFGYSTHKANRLKVTSDQRHWGSTGRDDHVWESSLWAMSLAYSTHFLKDELKTGQLERVYDMLRAECRYELERDVPTGYKGDTKAEENGWEADVLAATLGLLPDDKMAAQWFERMRLFAINSYSHRDDEHDRTVIDPWYDKTTVADLWRGANLYSDYTLQNHNYFHTSYQNVVIQELGEARLALELFQGDRATEPLGTGSSTDRATEPLGTGSSTDRATEPLGTGSKGRGAWRSNSLMHNNGKVMDNVLKWLATADGELAMPNGNDWSMFLFDQITSYSTMACFDRDADALMLENMAYKYIKARQSTTNDGSWLLNSDIGPRRMGVQGHRVMMTYLMHSVASTADMQPTAWEDFCQRYGEARRFLSQNIVRAATKDRFTVFSWSKGLKSYTGYIASCRPDVNKIMCPFKANNTGNLLGWYTVKDKKTDAEAVMDGNYNLMGNSYTMNGVIKTNEGTLQNSFAIWSTPGNAVVYLDWIQALEDGVITREQGGLAAISTDPFTKPQRTVYAAGYSFESNGSMLMPVSGSWANIDNQLGFVTTRKDGRMAFGDRALSSSVWMSKMYALWDDTERPVFKDGVVDRRQMVYYVNVDAKTTAELAEKTVSLSHGLPRGWNGVMTADPDGAVYMFVANFNGADESGTIPISYNGQAPVFDAATLVKGGNAYVKLRCEQNNSLGKQVQCFVSGMDGAVVIEGENITLINYGPTTTATLTLWTEEGWKTKTVHIGHGERVGMKK